MKRSQNLLLALAVIALMALPLRLVKQPVPTPNGTPAKIFQGSDDAARSAITTLAPSYQPWAKPVVEPPGEVISSLLFALQAALGAGFIGYYVGVSTTRAKLKRETDSSRC